MGFIVEITSRSGRVIERHRVDGDRITIGRGFDNEIILADPYVDVHHAVVESQDGQWTVEPTTPDAALWIDGAPVRGARVALRSGAALTFGRTHLRIYAPEHPVAPVLAFDRVEQLFAAFTAPSGIWIGVVGFVVLVAGDLYLRSYHTLEFTRILQELFGYLGLSIAWAAFWAGVARISRGEPRFFHHWLVAVAAIGINIVGEFLIEVIAFNTASVGASEVLRSVLEGLCLAFALTLNLRFALRQTATARHAWAQGFAWAVVGYGLLTTYSFESFFAGYPEYDGTVLPDAWRITSSIPADTFLERTEPLYNFPPEALE